MIQPYPLVCRPVFLEKVWGGRALERLGKALPNAALNYGESWELADMPSTSASGAGGEGVSTLIDNGPLAGTNLRAALESWGEQWPSVLIKFLDAREDLSVQVHPSPEFAKADPTAHLKTECWYVLQAQPGAMLYIGLKPGVTRAQFEKLARANDPGIVDAMRAIPAIPGECHNLPSGTVHALGKGVLVAEVQTPSDTTFRVYDWGRVGRELHVDQTLRSASFPGEPDCDACQAGQTRRSLAAGQKMARLVETEFFDVDELFLQTNASHALGSENTPSCQALIVTQGEAQIEYSSHGQSNESIRIFQGQTVVVPQAVLRAATLRAGKDFRTLIVHPK